ncbi:MAG: hypothetical protein AB7O28_00100 [Vicinamibacterales bacterium]
MRTITTSRGDTIEVDDTVDVLAILEALYHGRWRDEDSFDAVQREIGHLVGQLTDEECRAYLREALFMGYNTFENDKLGAVMKKLDTTEP